VAYHAAAAFASNFLVTVESAAAPARNFRRETEL